uniref:Replication factor A C-terminal domain-containing protein n=1 Tax=Lactuca sativa TaxID=4236 RepID=A0A9R1WWN8_LACSA|nr:hypothetical protein LSAT_V11C800438650 [Lactuca sativa]
MYSKYPKSFDVTKLFLNSDIVEIIKFKKELKADNNGELSKKSIATLPSYSYSYIYDFKGDFPLKTVCEITEPLKIDIVPKVNHSYNTTDKISETVITKCKEARCNTSDFRHVTKYMIPTNVQDATGTIGLTLFDRETKKLLDISAYQLRKIHEEAEDSLKLFPNQINILKNHKFAFLVDITSYNVYNYNNIYTILKHTEDVSIFSKFESKLELLVFVFDFLRHLMFPCTHFSPLMKNLFLHF